MPPKLPPVDGRDAETIRTQLVDTLPAYAPELDATSGDVGAAVLSLFAEMAENVTARLDEVPEKHRLAFYDMLGFGQAPPQPAAVPLTFSVSADVSHNVPIPGGTPAIAPAADEIPEQVFELPPDGGFEGTPAVLTETYSVDPATDGIYAHHTALGAGTETQLFADTDIQRHALCLGHPDLLVLEGEDRLWVTLTVSDGAPGVDQFATHLAWDYYGTTEIDGEATEGWLDLTIKSVTQGHEQGSSSVTFELCLPDTETETGETVVGGIESRWIRCRIARDVPVEGGDPVDLPAFFGSSLSDVTIALIDETDETDKTDNPSYLPDRLLSADVPLPVPTGASDATMIAPFGEEWPPRPTFYIASKAVFTKAEETTVLTFDAGDTPASKTTTEENQSANESVLELRAADQSVYRDEGYMLTVDAVSIPTNMTAVLTASKAGNGQTELGTSEPLTADDEERPVINLDSSEFDGHGPHMVALELKDEDSTRTTGKLEIDVFVRERAPPKLSWEYWNGDGWTNLTGVSDSTGALRRSGTVSFPVPPALEPTAVAGFDGHWIRARIVSGNYVELQFNEEEETSLPTGELPIFGHLSLSLDPETGAREPVHLVPDNNLTEGPDLARELFSSDSATISPFVGLPEDAQTLYLGFDRPLRGGPIQVLVSPTDVAYETSFYPRVRWEAVADPAADVWEQVAVVDGTEGLTEQGILELTFEDPTVSSVRFGTDRHWLRATVSGMAFEPGPATTDALDADSDVGIATVSPGAETVRLSNTGATEQSLARYTLVFECSPDDHQRWRLPDGTVAPPGGTTTVRFTESDTTANVGPHEIGITYEERSPFDPCVTTIVALESPDGETVDRWVEGRADPCERWLETVPPAGRPARTPPTLRGVYVNTTWARNVQTIEDEVLGSSDGTANQVFRVSTPPVLDATVWVDELQAVSPAERERLVDSATTAVRAETGPDRTTTAFWVAWHEVDSFLDATATDRVYTLDPTMGQIQFGDGERGRIPPRVADGISVAYRSGGGTGGNVRPGAITDLPRSIQYVDGVTNYLPADGGAPAEPLEQVTERASKTLRDRDRAVTAADIERLASTTSRRIARVRCLPGMDRDGAYMPGKVSLLVVPDDGTTKPEPSVKLREQVTTRVGAHAPTMLVAEAADDGTTGGSTLIVRGPSYVAIDVATVAVPAAVASISAFEALVTDTIASFLHPLNGGEDGAGWPFGKLPCVSAVFALLEGIEGLDHVEDLSLTIRGETDAVTVTDDETPGVAPDTLIYSGQHDVTVVTDDVETLSGGR